jgi:ribose-phosphate pyrophosphokinase
LDLHSGQIQGFFNMPVDNLKSDPVMLLYLREKIELLDSLVIVAPDAGSTKRARRLADRLEAKMALIDKRKEEETEHLDIVGELADNAVIVKDMIDTADSIVAVSNLLLKNGVKKVIVCASHGVLSGDAVEKINTSGISEVILTDSIPIQKRESVKDCSKITILSVAPLLGEAIRRVHNEESVSSLFRYE